MKSLNVIAKTIVIFGVFLAFFGVISSNALAQQACPFVITKFRAQTDVSQPWVQGLSVDLANTQSIRITAFQCTPEQTSACDIVANNAQINLTGAVTGSYTITGPDSIPTIQLTQPGTINVSVSTPGVSGAGCTDADAIVVTNSGGGNNNNNSCPFVITKFRAQLDDSQPWVENLNVNANANGTFRVTAFQCTQAQGPDCDVVSPNSVITLNGAGYNNATYNISGASSIPTLNVIQSGTITASVATPNSSGAACVDGGTITITSSGGGQLPVTSASFGGSERILPVVGGGLLLFAGVFLRYVRQTE